MISLDMFIKGFSLFMIIRYRSFFYDESTSKMIVQCMPSPVLESAVTIFREGFSNARSSMSAHRRRTFCL